jgi:hypothetical protein
MPRQDVLQAFIIIVLPVRATFRLSTANGSIVEPAPEFSDLSFFRLFRLSNPAERVQSLDTGIAEIHLEG